MTKEGAQPKYKQLLSMLSILKSFYDLWDLSLRPLRISHLSKRLFIAIFRFMYYTVEFNSGSASPSFSIPGSTPPSKLSPSKYGFLEFSKQFNWYSRLPSSSFELC